MPMMMNSNSSTPGAGSSRHSSPINGPLNTDGPIPPRLRGSPFLAAVSSSGSTSSTSSSSSSLTTLATLSNQQSLSSSLTSPYSYGSTLNNSDSALPQSLASTAAASANAQWNDHTTTRPTLVPHQLRQHHQQQQRIRTASTRAASVSSVASPSSMTALSTSSFSSSSSSSSSSTSTINRPGTPIPHICTDVNTFTPSHSHSLSLPNQRAKSPLAGSSSSPSSPPKHITIPPPPTIVPESLLSLGSGESASTPYPHPNPYLYPSSLSSGAVLNASALDDSSDLSSDDNDDDDAEEYFDSCSSAYISSPSTSASSSTSFSSQDSFNNDHGSGHYANTDADADVSSCFVVPNQAKKPLRPRGQSTPTTTACLGQEDGDAGIQTQMMDLGACFAAALTLGINNSVASQ